MTYLAGFLTPVPDDNREAYIESARKAWPLFREYGALQIMECWGIKFPMAPRPTSNAPWRWRRARASASPG